MAYRLNYGRNETGKVTVHCVIFYPLVRDYPYEPRQSLSDVSGTRSRNQRANGSLIFGFPVASSETQNAESPGQPRRGLLTSNIELLTSRVVEAPGFEPGSKEQRTKASTSVACDLFLAPSPPAGGLRQRQLGL